MKPKNVCTHVEAPVEDDDNTTKKPSIEMLEESYKELNSRKIKDSLSSFLPDIPGLSVYNSLAC